MHRNKIDARQLDVGEVGTACRDESCCSWLRAKLRQWT
jgi:hypothetical protein